MPGPFDAAVKQLLDTCGPDWVAWLAPRLGMPPGTAADPLDPDLSVVQPAADKVFRLLPPAAGLLHLEAQSSRDDTLPGRLLLYNVLLDHRYSGPVHTVVLLLRREAAFPDLTGTVTRADHAGWEYLRFGYGVVRVWELPADALLAAGPGLAPLALLTDDARPRLPEVVARFVGRVEREVPGANARGVVETCGFQLLGMRYDEAVLRAVIAGVRGMTRLQDTLFYRLLAESLREDFRAEGRAEGRAEALLEARRDDLLALLQEKFGTVPPGVEVRVRAATAPDRLAAALRQVLRINSPDELTL